MIKLLKGNIKLRETLTSGQCFRVIEEIDKSYTLVVSDRVINIKEDDIYLYVTSNYETNLKNVVEYYLDLTTNYEEINNYLISKDGSLKDTIEKINGYKVLRQDSFEMIISYIISQNNNIKRIIKSIDLLCEKYGEKVIFNDKEYHLFPNINDLASLSIKDYRNLGVGFRDNYLHSAIRYLLDNPDIIEKICYMDTESSLMELIKIKGIGIKVASCILLFGYHKLDVFPIDTWVKKYVFENYKIVGNVNKIKIFAKEKYGKYSGVALQYMFHTKRTNVK